MCNCGGGRRPVPGPAAAPAPHVNQPRAVAIPAPRGGTGGATGGGIDTALWGPPLWTALHTAAQFTNSDTHRSVWKRIFIVISSALPCSECSAHYNAWVAANPVPLPYEHPELQMALSAWFLALHNDVNVRNGKATWTIDQVTVTYSDKAAISSAVAALRPYITDGLLRHFSYFV